MVVVVVLLKTQALTDELDTSPDVPESITEPELPEEDYSDSPEEISDPELTIDQITNIPDNTYQPEVSTDPASNEPSNIDQAILTSNDGAKSPEKNNQQVLPNDQTSKIKGTSLDKNVDQDDTTLDNISARKELNRLSNERKQTNITTPSEFTNLERESTLNKTSTGPSDGQMHDL